MLIVTIAALVMAASLGWFAYRLMQEEQRRSEARVAVLTAALDDDAPLPMALHRATPVGFVAPGPVQAGARDEMPRPPDVVLVESDHRPLRAFRSEQVVDDPPTIDAPLQDAVAQQWITTQTPPAPQGAARSGGLFGDAEPVAASTDVRKVIGLAALVLVSLMAVAYLLFGRPDAPAPATASSVVAPEAAPATGIPLELRGLAHERTGDRLVVRGRVLNPVAGSSRASLVASVMLLDQAGGFLGSARTPIDVAQLRPGAEATFEVELPAHKDGRRYRVTFRGPDGALVPHVDKR